MVDDNKPIENSGITPKDIGEKLRKAREQQGLSVDDIQKITKLRKKYIEALETGDFDVFPGDVYAKGAIRNYAEAVHSDFTELWENYEQIFKSNKEEEQETEDTPLAVSQLIDSVLQILPAVVKILIIAILFVAIGYGGFLAYEYLAGVEINGEEETEETVSPEEEDEGEVDPDPEKSDELEEPEPDPVEPEVNRISDDPITYQISQYEEESVEALLEIGAHEAGCWVQITVDDGEPENLGTMASGEEDTVTFQESIEFYLGRPENASITVLGTELEIPDTTNPESVFIEVEQSEE